MSEFWEKLFQNGGDLWGTEPADSAIVAANMFEVYKKVNVLIPGIGYGRNVKPFLDYGINVSGIEISKTAIEILSKQFYQVKVHHGSVLHMPFDNEIYDGIYCYALLHLFGPIRRKQILSHCYEQLSLDGIMLFSVISTESDLPKSGKQISKNRYILPNGLKVFFYNDSAIKKEFSKFNLFDYYDLEEPVKFKSGEPNMKFKLIICKK